MSDLSKFVGKNAPTIFTALGIFGFVATVGMAIDATPKALALKEAVEDKQKDENPGEQILTFIRNYGPIYATTIAMGGISIACFLTANRALSKQSMTALAAYSMSEKALKTYQSKFVERFGARKHQQIMDDVAEEEVNRNDVPDEAYVFHTGYGDTLCLDAPSGRYFRCSAEQIRSAEASVTKDLVSEMTAPLNNFYNAIGLPGIGLGDDIGWVVDRMTPDVYFSSELTANDLPVLVINYNTTVLADLGDYNYGAYLQ